MTEIRKTSVILLLFWMWLGHHALAQNSVSISNSGEISIDLTSVIAAGMNVEVVADSTQWINYSMEVRPSEPNAYISVQISSGNLPEGLELFVEAGHYQGTSRGKNGRSGGKIRVDHIPKTLIHDIGTSFTGRGRYVGHQLIFSLQITNYALLNPGEYTFYVQYTLNQ